MRTRIIEWIRHWTIPFGVVTVCLYVAAIPFTILVFPKDTLVLTVVVLFSGFTSSMFSLGSALAVSSAVPPSEPQE